MSREITHIVEGGHLCQVVTPQRLRQILDEDGSDYTRPEEFNPDDEWEVEGIDAEDWPVV